MDEHTGMPRSTPITIHRTASTMTQPQPLIHQRLGLRSGDWVRVRTKQEILSTLDQNGRLEQMPFMPEMLEHCGKTFRVGKRAHKTCDPVNGLESRRLSDSVHLEGLRCDGAAHGGCQAGCLLFWKEAWLKPTQGPGEALPESSADSRGAGAACTEADLRRGTRPMTTPAEVEGQYYVCQATQVAAATTALPWWDARQYIEDIRSGNTTIAKMASALLFWLYHNLTNVGLGFGSAMRWAYDVFQKLIGGSPYPWRIGKVSMGAPTPSIKLDIKEGDVVRIKDYREILGTLNEEWKNRGLYFDAEMVPYTNGEFTVLKRVNRIIDEKTGKMLNFKNECLILDEVVCQARYAKCRKLCPRAYYLYWRDIWVEPVAAQAAAAERRGI
jgi:hypothetical protein